MKRVLSKFSVAALSFTIGHLAVVLSDRVHSTDDMQSSYCHVVEAKQKPQRSLTLAALRNRNDNVAFVSIYVSKKVEDVYSVDVAYPQVKGLNNNAAMKFNRWISNFILDDVAEFSGLEKAAVLEYKRTGKTPPIEESLHVSYEVMLATETIVSIRFTHVVMAFGQMHPIDYYVSINYDLKSGKFLKLGDLFKRRANFLETISTYCRDEIQKTYDMSYTNEEWMTKGLQPKSGNFANWNLTTEGIHISFEDYQVGSHAMGQPELTVPYDVLIDLLETTDALRPVERPF